MSGRLIKRTLRGSDAYWHMNDARFHVPAR